MLDPKPVKVMKIRCNSQSFPYFEMDLFSTVYNEKPSIEGYELFETDTNITHEYNFEEINGKWYVKTK